MNANGWRRGGRRLLLRLAKDQRVLFLLVGGSSTIFSTTLFVTLVLLFPGLLYFVSVAVAWAAALIATFPLYRRVVFQVKDHFWLDLARFAGVNTTSLLINMGAMALLSDLLALPPIPVQVGVTGIGVLFNYFGHKHFSFRREPFDSGRE